MWSHIRGWLSSLAEPAAPPAPRWNRVAPPGTGFSIDSPGSQKPSSVPGLYAYDYGGWSLVVKVSAHEHSSYREDLGRGDRTALERELQLQMESALRVWHAQEHSEPAAATLDGHPSLSFTFEDAQSHAFNVLVVTPERLYTVMAVGPKRASDEIARRFVRSFRLDPARP